jgi:hypothetical protein
MAAPGAGLLPGGWVDGVRDGQARAVRAVERDDQDQEHADEQDRACPLRARTDGESRGTAVNRYRRDLCRSPLTLAESSAYASSQADSEGSIPFTRSNDEVERATGL